MTVKELKKQLQTYQMKWNMNTVLSDKVIGKDIFQYKGKSYRLSSFLFVYDTSDGQQYRAYCDVNVANAVGGSGVAGVIAKIEDIEFIDRTTGWDDDILDSKAREHQRNVKQDSKKLERLLRLPDNLSSHQIRRIYNKLFFSNLKRGDYN